MQPDSKDQQPIEDLIDVLKKLVEVVTGHLEDGAPVAEIRQQLREQINEWPELSPDGYAAIIASLAVEVAQEKLMLAERRNARGLVGWRLPT